MAINKLSAAILRYGIAQGTRDKALRRDLGLSKTALARSIGISVRSLDRYLKGDRKPPSDVHLRLMSVAMDTRDAMRERFAAEARAQKLAYPPSRIPARVGRYKRPPSPLTGPVSVSEIIEVDTEGMDESDFLTLLREYFYALKATGKSWDVRLLVNVEVIEYFGDDGPSDESVADSLRGRRFVPIWLPPKPYISFVRASGSLKARDFESTIEDLKGNLATSRNKYNETYAGRLPSEGGFLKVAFVPYMQRDDAKRKRSRSAAAKRRRTRGK